MIIMLRCTTQVYSIIIYVHMCSQFETVTTVTPGSCIQCIQPSSYPPKVFVCIQRLVFAHRAHQDTHTHSYLLTSSK